VAELDLKNKLPLSERLDQYYEVSTIIIIIIRRYCTYLSDGGTDFVEPNKSLHR
jgi:hypothetical protein